MCLLQYLWPGNIRELLNLAEYLCISSRDAAAVALSHLPRRLAESFAQTGQGGITGSADSRDAILVAIQKQAADPAAISCLLEVLRARKRLVNGRATLIKEMLARDHAVSEGRRTRHLRLLRAAGLVRIGTTKQGTVLTSKGEEFLDYLMAAGGNYSGTCQPERVVVRCGTPT